MRHAVLIAAAAGATVMADETHTNFGNDWAYSVSWTVIGQTMTVPQDSNVLESFLFVAKTESEDAIPYAIAVYEWDAMGQHVAGTPLFGEFGLIDPSEPPLRLHEFGELLPEGQKIVVVLAFDPADDHGVGYTLGDTYDNGSWVSTMGDINTAWNLPENESYDVLFTAEWGSCQADMNGDGDLSILDFVAFQTAFTAGDIKADCDQNGIFNILDFVCFQQRFLEGC